MRDRAGRSGRLRVAAALALPLALAAAQLPWRALAAELVEVAQRGRAFAVREATVAPGATLRFTNEDDFPHQIQITGPGMSFDSPLQNAGQPIDVLFPAAGLYSVRCGVHPRMRMSVRVE